MQDAPRAATASAQAPTRVATKIVLSVVGTASFMTTLGTGLVNVANPSIRTYFDATLGEAAWVVTSYLLAVSALLLVFGRLGDIVGYSRLLAIGLVGFAATSLLCSLVSVFPLLIAGRLAQGAFAAILMAIGPALITTTVPPQERGRALGVLGTLTYLGLSAGPVIGGALVARFGWRAVFLVHLPIAACALGLMRRMSSAAPAGGPRRRIDAPSALLWGVALSCALLAMSSGERKGWTSPFVLGLTVAAIATGGIFIFWQRRAEHPLIPGALFRNATFRNSTVAALLLYCVSFIMMFTLPFFLQGAWAMNPATIGLVMACQPVLMALVAPLSGSLSDRAGPRVPASIGMAIIAVAVLAIAHAGAHHTLSMLLVSLAAFGVGAGLFTTANNSAIMGSAPKTQQGIASAILGLARNVGMAAGVGAGGAMLALFRMDGTARADERALTRTFAVASVLAVVGALFSWARGAESVEAPAISSLPGATR